MDTSSPAALVNAQMLNMFVGRRVRTVVQVQHNEGGVLVGQSTDGHQLCVKSAMDVPVSHFMEVYGIAENSQTIRAEVCTDFGPNFGEISNAFDPIDPGTWLLRYELLVYSECYHGLNFPTSKLVIRRPVNPCP
ncbi:Pollen-specific protein like [Zea mays]|uniref:Pollen-specific protein like n=1 Tax=Zea mays TaxID=4577 RepID=A0A1D6FC38_MAIZE|nr:Pollen-specific protein like [Zea mays]